MPRYFFDIQDDDGLQHDDEGVELAHIEMVRLEAQRVLPRIAYEEARGARDRGSYTVLVTDEDGQPIYSAALSYTGHWLLR